MKHKEKTLTEVLDLIKENEIRFYNDVPDKFKGNMDVINCILKNGILIFKEMPDIIKNDKEFLMMIAKEKSYEFENFPDWARDDKDIALTAVGGSPSAPKSVSERLKNDIDIVLASVAKYGSNLEYFSDEFKDNDRVLEECMKERYNPLGGSSNDGSAYEYFSDRLKTKRQVALQMSLGSGFNLGAAPENFRNDREIVKNAIESNASNFEHLGSELLADLDFLKELYYEDEEIISYMSEDLKYQLFTTQIKSVEHWDKKIIYEMLIHDGYVENKERPVKSSSVQQGKNELLRCDNFPVLTYENDGPVGSYLSVRYLNNIVLVGVFTFFVKKNTGNQTSTNFLTRSSDWMVGPEAQLSDDFLKHEVYLIPETTKNIDYSNLCEFPRLYFGRPNNLPRGIQLFYTYESYSEALTVLNQENTYGEPKFKKINDNTLEAINGNSDEVFGAARVYIDGFGWRFLIPHKEGALKALDVLKSTTHNDDLNWIQLQNGILSEYQKKLLKKHFGDLYK